MSFTHSFTHTMNDGLATLGGVETVTAGASDNLDEVIPTPSTNLAVAFAFTKAKLKSFFMIADQALSVMTNAASTGSPQETITLAANVPYQWTTGSGLANPFGGNVTSLFVTNASGVETTLRVRTIIDPT